MKSTFPTFQEETLLWNRDYLVVGIDEVGRGAFAGPLVAASVAFGKRIIIPKDILINDSKKLTSKQREKSSVWIKDNCIGYGIGVIGVSVINKQGIVAATQKAFRQSFLNLQKRLNTYNKYYILADAFYTKYVKGVGLKNQKAIIRGDQKSFSIAAASIIAKVYRDSLMKNLSQTLKNNYFWETNKGYGTKKHIESIKEYGITKFHRLDFIDSIWV